MKIPVGVLHGELSSHNMLKDPGLIVRGFLLFDIVNLLVYSIRIRYLRLSVRTLPFQGGKRGSIPLGSAILIHKYLMRLIALGDSLTSKDKNWPNPLSEQLNCELINFGITASQNLLQIQIFQDWLLDNDLKADDIVIWQIGMSSDPVIAVGPEHTNRVERLERIMQNKFFMSHYFMRDENKIDNERRINLLHVSPMYRKFNTTSHPNPEADVLQNMLFIFLMIKKMCPRLLVVLGADWMIKKEHWENMKKFFGEKNIDFVDESIVSWCIDKKLQFLEDLMESPTSHPRGHPTEESVKIYTDEVLLPKLKSLGWI